jgi:hypothetical protein
VTGAVTAVIAGGDALVFVLLFVGRIKMTTAITTRIITVTVGDSCFLLAEEASP